MEPSKFQSAIYDAIGQTNDNLAVNAVAGSGKTTTIVRGLQFIPMEKQTIFLAFNRDIANELKNRVPPNTQASTLNAFGWGVCRRNIKGVELDTQKTNKILMSQFDMNNKEEKSKYYQFRNPVQRLVSLLKAQVAQPEECRESLIQAVAEERGVEVPDSNQFFSYVVETYQRSCRNVHYMDFDDQVFMPVYMHWHVSKVDVCLGDEVQDWNISNRLLATRSAKRMICVGDPRQSIYGFRGADPQAMQNLIAETNAKSLPLSICYRCAKNIVKEAQKIVSEIEFWDQSSDGIVDNMKPDLFQRTVQEHDFVLCRVTSPLVSQCLKFIRDGRKAYVKGKDIGQNVIVLIDKISHGQDEMDTHEFFEAAAQYQLQETQRLARAERDEEIEVLNDKIETLNVILEACKTVKEMKIRVDEIFYDPKPGEKTSGIILSTAHRAKGLETDRVFILKPELMPHYMAKKPAQKEQEMNLKYVAITRAKRELYWVKA
jgi:DNA helicase-2/ATP-dependent DNA helicase PcrA